MVETAVVTGANSGIGLATTLRLAADGYEVFAGSRRTEGLDDISSAAAGASLAHVHPILLDVGDDASVAAAFVAAQANGPITVLVNNAGVSGGGTVEETPLSTYESMFDTNVLGVIRCTQQVLPGMREARSGRIVNISSASAIIGPPAMSAYALTKFALEGLSESLQAEVAPFGIRVVVLRPGTIMTPIWGKAAGFPQGSPYAGSHDFLMQILTHHLTQSGVGAEMVADVIGDAVADDAPSLRHLVGDADVLARMREQYTDDEIFGLYFLDDEALRERYRALSGVDYWA
jgi:NAD(P)-dependent dehydrogenase (short-subunit alcohol dehydrogenase family)